MATVYRALDRHTGDTVAVKLLHTGDPTALSRFELEVGALAALDHPAKVRLLAHGKWPGGRPMLRGADGPRLHLVSYELDDRRRYGPAIPAHLVLPCGQELAVDPDGHHRAGCHGLHRNTSREA